MNPFTALSQIQQAYLTYVHTFQKFQNPAIRDWVAERVEKGTLLWRDPYIQLSRRFEEGETLQALVEVGLLHPDTPACFTTEPGDCDGRSPAGDFSLCYLHHLGRRYWVLLEQHGFLEGPLGQNATCVLADYYQFFREVFFALELGGSFVLLHDARSSTFSCDGPCGKRGLMPFLLSLVPRSLHARVATVCIQQLVAAVKSSGQHAWITEFERKYGLE